jgi:ATP-dependent HslUV protease ATP-binding subunit HslU
LRLILINSIEGRLPIKVTLNNLTKEDYYRILTEPETNLIKQNIALIKTEDIILKFTDDGIKELSSFCYELNNNIENIGIINIFH